MWWLSMSSYMTPVGSLDLQKSCAGGMMSERSGFHLPAFFVCTDAYLTHIPCVWLLPGTPALYLVDIRGMIPWAYVMQSQHVPHSYDCNSVNIQAIALVFVALDSSFQGLQK